MEIHEYHQDGILVINVSGQVDSVTAPMLGDKLNTAISEGHTYLVLDLGGVPYMSSAGLRVLSIALKTVRAAGVGGEVCLACLSKTVAHAFRISGFSQVFNIYDNVPAAVTAMAMQK
ncbi:MAG: STAS domain-containing protein [Anaerolineae bacterium]